MQTTTISYFFLTTTEPMVEKERQVIVYLHNYLGSNAALLPIQDVTVTWISGQLLPQK
jgi:hypothetical protein